jgi:hypothetical protein
MGDQLELDDAWPVLPKPPRGTLLVVPGRVVVGVVAVVVDTRAGVGVAVRENAGRDQWLPLLVRAQPEPDDPPLPHERRGEHPSGFTAPGTAGPVAAGGVPGGQLGGVMA